MRPEAKVANGNHISGVQRDSFIEGEFSGEGGGGGGGWWCCGTFKFCFVKCVNYPPNIEHYPTGTMFLVLRASVKELTIES